MSSSQFWRLGNARSRCQQIYCLVRALFQVCRLVFSYPLKAECRVSIRVLIAFRRLHLHDLAISQRAHIQIPPHLGFRLQHMNLGETDAHSIATTYFCEHSFIGTQPCLFVYLLSTSFFPATTPRMSRCSKEHLAYEI